MSFQLKKQKTSNAVSLCKEFIETFFKQYVNLKSVSHLPKILSKKDKW